MLDPSITIRRFLAQHHAAHLAPTTLVDYDVQVRHFERYFAAWQVANKQPLPARPPTLADLCKAHIHGAVDARLAAGKEPPTADKVRRALLAIWNKAAELTDDRIAPPGKIRGQKKPEHSPVAWTVDEFGRLLWGASQLDGRVGPWLFSAWMPALLWTVYNSGLRITATMAIRRSWVNVTSRRLVVSPKVQKDDEGRSVALLPETMEALAPLLANGKGGPFDDWPHDRRTIHYHKMQKWPALTLALKKSIVAGGLADNVEQITRRDLWHKIRRTFATQIYLATGSIEEVKQRLGHSSIEVSYAYIDMSQVEQRSEADLLPRPKAQRLRIVDG